MKINEIKIPGCYEIIPNIFEDERGKFIKTFHQGIFEASQLNLNLAEEYYSVSYKGVLRGLHFQLPPKEHTKMAYCIKGEVIDVLLDLRVGSPKYGAFETINLSEKNANILYIPPGIAHGFYVLSDTAVMIYKVSTVYDAGCDSGIHWNSIGLDWHNDSPVISKRDSEFSPLSLFDSPFTY